MTPLPAALLAAVAKPGEQPSAGRPPAQTAAGGLDQEPWNDRSLLTAWRIDAQRFAPTWDSGLGAEQFGGRWNPKGLRVIYCSLDPATCLVEAAVHRGFEVLDTQPHVLTRLQVQPAGLRVVQPDELPNPAWLHGGIPSAGQQRFGAALLQAHGIVVLPSVVSRPSWNLLIAPDLAAGRWQLAGQGRLVVDTRLHPA